MSAICSASAPPSSNVSTSRSPVGRRRVDRRAAERVAQRVRAAGAAGAAAPTPAGWRRPAPRRSDASARARPPGAGIPARSRNSSGKSRMPRGFGAAELVDRLVRVADGDDLPARLDELAEQADLRRVGVLVLVDEHDLGRSPYLRADLGVGEQHARAVDQLGVVEDLLVLEDVQVLVEELPQRHPRGPLGDLPVHAQRLAVEPQLTRGGQRTAHLAGEATGPVRRCELRRPVRRPTDPPAPRVPGSPAPARSAAAASRRTARRPTSAVRPRSRTRGTSSPAASPPTGRAVSAIRRRRSTAARRENVRTRTPSAGTPSSM